MLTAVAYGMFGASQVILIPVHNPLGNLLITEEMIGEKVLKKVMLLDITNR